MSPNAKNIRIRFVYIDQPQFPTVGKGVSDATKRNIWKTQVINAITYLRGRYYTSLNYVVSPDISYSSFNSFWEATFARFDSHTLPSWLDQTIFIVDCYRASGADTIYFGEAGGVPSSNVWSYGNFGSNHYIAYILTQHLSSYPDVIPGFWCWNSWECMLSIAKHEMTHWYGLGAGIPECQWGEWFQGSCYMALKRTYGTHAMYGHIHIYDGYQDPCWLCSNWMSANILNKAPFW